MELRCHYDQINPAKLTGKPIRMRSRIRVDQPETTPAIFIAEPTEVAADDDDAPPFAFVRYGARNLVQQLGAADHRMYHRCQKRQARREWLRIEAGLLTTLLNAAWDEVIKRGVFLK